MANSPAPLWARSCPLVFVQRDFGGFDDVRQDAQLLGGAAVQGVRQLGQGAAALAAAVEQQLVRLHAEGVGQPGKDGQAQLGVARLDMWVTEMPARAASSSCERPCALRYFRMRCPI